MWINTQTNAYPLHENDIRAALPTTSFGQPFAPPEPYAWVAPSPRPAFNPLTQKLVEAAPELEGALWVQRWSVLALTPAEAAAALEAHKASVYSDVVMATQARLDAFARTRNYDGILSACTYATSPTAKFAQEGQCCVDARDATWAALYAMLDEVKAGTRPVPNSFADIADELPALSWPA